ARDLRPRLGARRTGAQHRRRGDVLQREAALGRDLLGTHQRLQTRDRRVHDVDRVVAAQRLAQHVLDAGGLQHRAHRATRDHTGTGARRTQQDLARRVPRLHQVRDGALDPRHLEGVLLGLLDALGDRRGHLLGLAVADADGAVAVTDDHQGGEAEATPALDDLGDPVDRHDLLDVRLALVGATAAVVAAIATVATL